MTNFEAMFVYGDLYLHHISKHNVCETYMDIQTKDVVYTFCHISDLQDVYWATQRLLLS